MTDGERIDGLEKKIDKVIDKQTVNNEAIAAVKEQIKSLRDVVEEWKRESKDGYATRESVDNIEKRVCTLEDDSEELKGFQNKALGILAFIALFASAVAAWVWDKIIGK